MEVALLVCPAAVGQSSLWALLLLMLTSDWSGFAWPPAALAACSDAEGARWITASWRVQGSSPSDVVHALRRGERDYTP